MSLLLAITAVFAIAALVLIARGWRGVTIDDHPLCRRCGFDLVGAPADAVRCPECGHETSRPRRGHRRRRTAPLAGGLAMLLVAFVVVAGVATIRVRNVDWRAWLPSGYLLREAERAAIVDRVDPVERLLARDATLDPAQRDRLGRVIVALQLDPSNVWRPAWGDWLARQLLAGTLPADVRDRFVANLFADAVVKMRPVVRQGDAIPMFIDLSRTRGGLSGVGVMHGTFDTADRTLRVDGVARPPFVAGSGTVVSSTQLSDTGYSLTLASSGVRTDELSPGPHAVEWACPIVLRAGPLSYTVPAPAAPKPASIASATVTFRGTITIVPRDDPAGVVLDPDPAVTEQVRAAMRNVRLVRGTTTSTPMLYIDFTTTLPLDLAVDVVACETDGREQVLTTVRRNAASRPGNFGWGLGPLPRTAATSVELILRANPEVARQSVDLIHIWGGELRLPDVPIEDPNAPAGRVKR